MSKGRVLASTLGRRKPSWLRKEIQTGRCLNTESIITKYGLNTVCDEALCPNRNECYSTGTATFIILGDVCTRNCLFCNVTSGRPDAVMEDEPERVAEASKKLGLKYCVITSVTRDDLPDGGSKIFAESINAVRETAGCFVEVLTPDFKGDKKAIQTVIDARPDIYNHNIETIKRLYDKVRPQANYQRTLDLLSQVNENGLPAKSGVMVGLGETDEELFELFQDLIDAGCYLLTIGQYLQPSVNAVSVYEYIEPDHFEYLKEKALAMGFKGVASGPFVRSSYNAFEMYMAGSDRTLVS